MNPSLRQLVAERAGGRCEYCRMPQAREPFFTYHVEHIVARQHGGPTVESNLAFSCHHRNLHKGPNLTAIDPETGQVERLFNPRMQVWQEHFEAREGLVSGRSPIGRSTAALSRMNAPLRVQLRRLPEADVDGRS